MAALCGFLAVACTCDYRRRKIPNGLLFGMAVFGVGWHLWSGGIRGAVICLGEAAIVMALLYPLFKIGGLGAGDIKLLGITAGYLPPGRVVFFLFFSLLAAAVISVMKMSRENSFGERLRYLSEYLADVVQSGEWHIYLENVQDRRAAGICLSGPVLFSVALYVGGIY